MEKKQVVEIILGSVNIAPSMWMNGIVGVYTREYTILEFVDWIKAKIKAGVQVRSFLTDEELISVLKNNYGVDLPEKDPYQPTIFGLSAYSVYYKVTFDRADKIIIHRWNNYPVENIEIKNRLED